MKRFTSHLQFLLGLHCLGLLLSSLFRLILFVTGHSLLDAGSLGKAGLQSMAFLRGLWFDNVIGCYILILPLAVLVVTDLAGLRDKYPLRFSLRWMQSLWAVSFAVSAAKDRKSVV